MDAQAFALKAHAGQRYGDAPYAAHLAAVVAVLVEHGRADLAPEGWLHDVLEDTDTTYADLSAAFGAAVADHVEALTGRGHNRKARNASVYGKLRAHPQAVPVKVADRIVNVRTSRAASPAKFAMYREESAVFRAAMLAADPDLDPRLLAALDAAYTG